jgi:hypothetical protein
MSTPTERQALILTEKEWAVLNARIKASPFLRNRGVEVYTEPCPGMVEPHVFVTVRAANDIACGIGIGWLTAQGEYYQHGCYTGVNG